MNHVQTIIKNFASSLALAALVLTPVNHFRSNDTAEAGQRRRTDRRTGGEVLSQTPSPASPVSADVEQTAQGVRPSAKLVESFDGLGFGFQGPQGAANVRNPSDNSLAVGHRSHRPDRQHAHGDLHEEGQTVRYDGQGLIWSSGDQRRVRRIRRPMRDAEQRRRCRSLRSVGRSLADRDADLRSWSGATRPADRVGVWASRPNVSPPGRPRSAGRQSNFVLHLRSAILLNPQSRRAGDARHRDLTRCATR